jgi:hypothetical protein
MGGGAARHTAEMVDITSNMAVRVMAFTVCNYEAFTLLQSTNNTMIRKGFS